MWRIFHPLLCGDEFARNAVRARRGIGKRMKSQHETDENISKTDPAEPFKNLWMSCENRSGRTRNIIKKFAKERGPQTAGRFSHQ